MNSCVLMAKIVKSPELRYTPDNQVAIASMLVQFEGLGNDAPYTLKAVGWGNLATDINETYSEGDQVILEGRLGMNVFERKEGFKEKRAEFTISRIFPLGANTSLNLSTSQPSPNNVVPFQNSTPETSASQPTVAPPPATDTEDKNLDDIPF